MEYKDLNKPNCNLKYQNNIYKRGKGSNCDKKDQKASNCRDPPRKFNLWIRPLSKCLDNRNSRHRGVQSLTSDGCKLGLV